ncbi:hypothetical protein EJ08DRAFT_675672 [Tothia fuscella]|uniref:F-box domain-containing protein n=1 Tax=Tothia fuscella TaxID=1048955 RepID=A0A9P4NZM6_9PEZI|nr:hypothetical protein EJ08DRAFT_675672 [Tothia fuscella]
MSKTVIAAKHSASPPELPDLPYEVWKQIFDEVGTPCSFYHWITLRNVCHGFRAVIEADIKRVLINEARIDVHYSLADTIPKNRNLIPIPYNRKGLYATRSAIFQFSHFSKGERYATFTLKPTSKLSLQTHDIKVDGRSMYQKFYTLKHRLEHRIYKEIMTDDSVRKWRQALLAAGGDGEITWDNVYHFVRLSGQLKCYSSIYVLD